MFPGGQYPAMMAEHKELGGNICGQHKSTKLTNGGTEPSRNYREGVKAVIRSLFAS
ncbi:hypothetical protein OH492_03435 [Vibrio chagasii]|nr:hypothetical protein [Vibrio chagasii]